MNDRPNIEPADPSPPAQRAEELFAHGLLSHVTRDDAASRDRRVHRAMTAIAAQRGSGPLAFLARAPARWAGIAAAVVFASVALFFLSQVQSSAQAVVQESISALRAPGDRRFELTITYDDQATQANSTGTIDTRDGGQLLLQFRAPNGRNVVVGRDEQGPWAIRKDGGVEREHPERAWPKWASVGDEDITADSVDRLLEALSKNYTMQRRGIEELENKRGRRFDHLAGERNGHTPGAAHVEIWIDRETKLIERLEMRWDAHAPGAGRPQGPEGQPLGEPQDRPDGPPLGAPGDQPDRPLPGDMDQPGPDGPPDGPGQIRRPDFPDGAGAPDDRDPPRDRPFPPRPRPGIAPPGPQGPPPFGRPGPRRVMNPPRLLVLDRVDAPKFEQGWFSPEAHVER